MDFKHPIQAVIPGTQGRILAVLAQTTAALNLRTVARLADVSPAQASRVLPGLVELGLVERQEVPPSSLFCMNVDNIAARSVIQIARSRDLVLEQMGIIASELPTQPVSVIIFGSFARHEADHQSDIDAVFISPLDHAVDDDVWIDGMELWREQVNRLSGNRVEVVEVNCTEVSAKLASTDQLWLDIARDGIVVHGELLDELRKPRHAKAS